MADVADRSAAPGDDFGPLAPPAHHPPDERLLARVAGGDAAAVGVLYGRHGRLAYSQALRVCGDAGAAEDAVRETFVELWRDPGRYDPTRGPLSRRLLAEVHYRAVEAVRRRRRPPADRSTPEAVASGRVAWALGQLSGEQRRVLALIFYGGYTQPEVAAITGVRAGTVGTRLYGGVQRLRRLLSAARRRGLVRPLGSSDPVEPSRGGR